MNDERNISASDSVGSVGTDSGSAGGSGASGGNGSAIGNGGDSSGNSGNVSRSASGSDNSADDGLCNTSSTIGLTGGDFGIEDSVAEQRTVAVGGFGDAVRDRLASDNSDSGNSADGRTESNSEIPFRLGKKQRGRPRGTTTKESSGKSLSTRETKDMVSVFVSSLFDIPAILLKADFWRLSDDETEILTGAFLTWVDSLPKSKSNKFTKWIAENMPVLNFAMVALFIVGERAKKTVEVMKAQKQVTDAQQAVAFNNANNVQNFNNGGIITPLDFVHGNIQ